MQGAYLGYLDRSAAINFGLLLVVLLNRRKGTPVGGCCSGLSTFVIAGKVIEHVITDSSPVFG